MYTTLIAVQTLNGLQLGIILFLRSHAGLTLVFGVMDFINLAHGVQYMVGAYFAFTFTVLTGSFTLGLLLALPAALLVGLILEVLVFRHLYDRRPSRAGCSPLSASSSFLNQGVKVIWGASPLYVPVPELLQGSIEIFEGFFYPVYRLAIIGGGARRRGAALLSRELYPRRHAGARGRHQCADGLGAGHRYPRLFMVVFGFGAIASRALPGRWSRRFSRSSPRMGDNLLIVFSPSW